jgi:hypothetical protein
MQNVDAGVVAERLCMAAAALGLATHVRCDYSEDINAVLGLRPGAERVLAMVLVGAPRTAGMAGQALWIDAPRGQETKR